MAAAIITVHCFDVLRILGLGWTVAFIAIILITTRLKFDAVRYDDDTRELHVHPHQ